MGAKMGLLLILRATVEDRALLIIGQFSVDEHMDHHQDQG